jgi:maltose O-acetyltransferase
MGSSKRIAFRTYSYAEHLFWGASAILPPFLRQLIFRLTFKHLGRGCLIDYGVYVRYPWKVSIGEGSTLNRGCQLYSSHAVKDAEIVIGKGVAVGPDVKMFGADHDHGSLELPDIAGTIRIGDYVWIGGGAIILSGVELGEGCVIGAGSVVSMNIPAYTVAVGNPARAIKPRVLADMKND